MDQTEYRNEVEKEICQIENEIWKMKEKVNELSKSLPREEIKDYDLALLDGSEIKFSELFGNQDELILVHNMGPGCPYCTLWADGFKGFIPYLESRCAFWMETDKQPQALDEFSKKRDWNFNVVSSVGSSLKIDLGFQKRDGDKTMNYPGFSTFYKEDGKIFRHATAPFGPGDDYCSIWPMISRLKNGQNGWQPKFNL